MTLIFLILVFMLAGVAVYAIDLKIVSVFSKKRLAEGTAKGALVGRTIRAKLIVAGLLILLRTYFAVKHGHTDFMWDIVYGVVIYVSMILGFYIAPGFIKKFPGKMQKTLKYLEALESGKADPLKDLKDLKNRTTETVKDKVVEQVFERVIPEEIDKVEIEPEKELTIEEKIEKFKNT